MEGNWKDRIGELMYFFHPKTIRVPGKKLPYEEQIRNLKEQINTADAIVIGAGSGLSTAAGLTYSGERFQKYFFDFAKKYPIRDMYSGGFYPFEDMEVFWAWWSRHIYFNRYMDAPSDVYGNLKKLVDGRDYFVLTTNVDHQFQRAGFEKKRLFYTQGDYGLLQSSHPSVAKTYENQEIVEKMLKAQGFVRNKNGVFQVPEDGQIRMRIPSELIPLCPDDGLPMITNLRADDFFVEDEGWHQAASRYQEYLQNHEGQHILYLELGVGMNTPVIIKFPFWRYTEENENAYYACLNYGEAGCSEAIVDRSICMDENIAQVLRDLLS